MTVQRRGVKVYQQFLNVQAALVTPTLPPCVIAPAYTILSGKDFPASYTGLEQIVNYTSLDLPTGAVPDTRFGAPDEDPNFEYRNFYFPKIALSDVYYDLPTITSQCFFYDNDAILETDTTAVNAYDAGTLSVGDGVGIIHEGGVTAVSYEITSITKGQYLGTANGYQLLIVLDKNLSGATYVTERHGVKAAIELPNAYRMPVSNLTAGRTYVTNSQSAAFADKSFAADVIGTVSPSISGIEKICTVAGSNARSLQLANPGLLLNASMKSYLRSEITYTAGSLGDVSNYDIIEEDILTPTWEARVLDVGQDSVGTDYVVMLVLAGSPTVADGWRKQSDPTVTGTIDTTDSVGLSDAELLGSNQIKFNFDDDAQRIDMLQYLKGISSARCNGTYDSSTTYDLTLSGLGSIALHDTVYRSLVPDTVGTKVYIPAVAGVWGLDDLTSGGSPISWIARTYEVEIDGVALVNTFRWRADAGAWTAGVAITGAAQTLNNGVTITFGATGGHTIGDSWQFSTTTNWAGFVIDTYTDALAAPHIVIKSSNFSTTPPLVGDEVTDGGALVTITAVKVNYSATVTAGDFADVVAGDNIAETVGAVWSGTVVDTWTDPDSTEFIRTSIDTMDATVALALLHDQAVVPGDLTPSGTITQNVERTYTVEIQTEATIGAKVFTGVGLDDATSGGAMVANLNNVFEVEIDSIAGIGAATAVGGPPVVNNATSGGALAVNLADNTYTVEIDQEFAVTAAVPGGAPAVTLTPTVNPVTVATNTADVYVVTIDNPIGTFTWTVNGGGGAAGVAYVLGGPAIALQNGVEVAIAGAGPENPGDNWTFSTVQETFEWSSLVDPLTSNVVCTDALGVPAALSNGVTVHFGVGPVTWYGHTLGDTWTISTTQETFAWTIDGAPAGAGVPIIAAAANALGNGVTVTFATDMTHTLADLWSITTTQETYQWGFDNGATWEATGQVIVALATDVLLAGYGAEITFATEVGHTLHDRWILQTTRSDANFPAAADLWSTATVDGSVDVVCASGRPSVSFVGKFTSITPIDDYQTGGDTAKSVTLTLTTTNIYTAISSDAGTLTQNNTNGYLYTLNTITGADVWCMAADDISMTLDKVLMTYLSSDTLKTPKAELLFLQEDDGYRGYAATKSGTTPFYMHEDTDMEPTYGSTTVTVPAGGYINIDGTLREIKEASLAIYYRALLPSLAAEMREFTSLSEVEDLFDGSSDEMGIQNPYGYMVKTMLSITGGVQKVYARGVDETLFTNFRTAYLEALNLSIEDDSPDPYALIPATQDPTVHGYFAAHVTNMEQNLNRWRVALLSNRMVDEEAITGGAMESVTDAAIVYMTSLTPVTISTSVMPLPVDYMQVEFDDSVNDPRFDLHSTLLIGVPCTLTGTGSTLDDGTFTILQVIDNKTLLLDYKSHEDRTASAGASGTIGSPNVLYAPSGTDWTSYFTLTGNTYRINFASASSHFETDDYNFHGEFSRQDDGAGFFSVGFQKVSTLVSGAKPYLTFEQDNLTHDDDFTEIVFGDKLYGDILTDVTLTIRRKMTATQMAQYQASYAASTTYTRRIVFVWPPCWAEADDGIDSIWLPGTYAAAALGAMTVVRKPQQGFSGTTIGVFKALKYSKDTFTEDQLDTIAGGGVMIYYKRGASDPTNRHQLTADVSAILYQEYSITKNVDYVTRQFENVLRPFFEGESYNITEATLREIRTRLEASIRYMSDVGRTGDQFIGAILRSGVITQLIEDPDSVDAVYITVDALYNKPLNNITMIHYIS